MTIAVVLGGTGSIGVLLVEQLAREHSDWEIRVVTRSPNDDPTAYPWKEYPNVQVIQGDPFDKSSVLAVTKECDLIFCCIGFHRYERGYWAKHWPLTVDHILAAVVNDGDASLPRKKLIFCDNLYAYGHGTDIHEKTPTVTPSLQSKPGIRSLLHEKFATHMTEYPDTIVVVGGAEFFGPNITEKSFLGDAFTGKLMTGSSAMVFGSADVHHDFCYAPDFAATLARVATDPAAYNHFWICPHAIHGKTMRQIATDVCVKAEKPVPPKIWVLGKWTVYSLAPFMSIIREMIEMMPGWTQAYTVKDSAFVKQFGLRATPYDDAIQALVDSYKK